ncbi:7SK snRNA methylphosphate capping enzyme [Petaurus breviceps papuanus]|uniref:7SK snRNA methylphosphate capping enzyme n=1 Tax=Petaurus breviceps papuanus TaxID=3040969 RepID=UPI0036DCD612
MIEMAAEKEPFLVPAPPPPPLKADSSGGGGTLVQPYREASSGELCGGTAQGPNPHTPTVSGREGFLAPSPSRAGQNPKRSGDPMAQGEARPSEAHGEAPPPDMEEERRGWGGAELGTPAPPRQRNGFQPHRPPGTGGNKRRNSCNVGGFKHPAFKRRRRVNSDCDPVLPSNFLLGGNIFDPLNLNSLLDEEVSRALNAETPKSSPLPAKGRDPVEILIPKDITDPLSLNACTDEAQVVRASPLKTGRKRHRHRGQHHQQQAGGPGGNDPTSSALPPTSTTPSLHGEATPQQLQQRQRSQGRDGPQPYELNTAINCRDEVVSPLLPAPQDPPGTRAAPSATSTTPAPLSSSSRHHRKRRRTSSKSESGARAGGQGPKEKVRARGGGRHHDHPLPAAGFKKQQSKFQYGNYCKYYGYRNPNCEDGRLRVMRPEWFQGRDVLDLGCNVGHLTLSIACKWGPARVVGVDIDARLIHSARQNIRHYLSEELRLKPQPPEGVQGPEGGKGIATTRKKSCFPASLTASRGPIAAPQVPLDGADASIFPNNVVFITGNYVLDRDELVEAQAPEYDVVLCLSLTKWVHLNWGDEGLKRMFRRIYRHLRPGGILVLEPQPWSSYGKRKTLTETIYKNYYRIQLKPEQFSSYLTSPEVGFSSYELVATPHNSSKGFQRPVYLFHKANSPSH